MFVFFNDIHVNILFVRAKLIIYTSIAVELEIVHDIIFKKQLVWRTQEVNNEFNLKS